MSYGISLHVWGDLACFTRPELKSERMSYEVMTPSAARGILSAIYWKPGFEWIVDRIHVLKPIRTMQVRRNELGCKMKMSKKSVSGIMIEEKRQQRASTLLRDVGYVIDAHVKVIQEQPGINAVAKHLEMFKRRASRGQCFHQPCLGNREFPAMFELVDEEHPMPLCELPPAQRNRSLGLMFHDMEYVPDKKRTAICAHMGEKKLTASASPRFFLAELADGVLTVPPFHQTLS